jgi:hypothetical protein
MEEATVTDIKDDGTGYFLLQSVPTKMGVWDVTPCRWVDRYHSFGGRYCLHLPDRTVSHAGENTDGGKGREILGSRVNQWEWHKMKSCGPAKGHTCRQEETMSEPMGAV